MLELLVIFLKSKSKWTFLPSFTGLLWLVTLMCPCIDTYLYCSCFFLSVHQWVFPHGSAHSVPETGLGTPTIPCQASSHKCSIDDYFFHRPRLSMKAMCAGTMELKLNKRNCTFKTQRSPWWFIPRLLFTCCGPIASVFLGTLRNLSRDEDIPGWGREMFISVLTLLLLWIVHELSHSLF